MSFLERIPFETRMMIYEYLFETPDNTIEPISRRESHRLGLPSAHRSINHRALEKDTRTSHLSLSILRVNRTIHAEAQPIFYKTTTFYFTSVFAIERLLHGTSWPATHLIQKISLSLDEFRTYYPEQFTHKLRHLASRTIKTTRDSQTNTTVRTRTLKSIQILLNITDLIWLAQRPRRSSDPALLTSLNSPSKIPFFDDIYSTVGAASKLLPDVVKSIKIVGVENDEEARDYLRMELPAGGLFGQTVQDLSQIWGGKVFLGEDELLPDKGDRRFQGGKYDRLWI